MQNFNTNQVRQLYVGKYVEMPETGVEGLKNGELAIGTVGPSGAAEDVYIAYRNLDGALVRSDTIPVGNIEYYNLKDADDLVVNGKGYNIALASGLSVSDLEGSNVRVTVKLHEYLGLDYGETHSVIGGVHVTSNSTMSDIYKAIAVELARQSAQGGSPNFLVGLAGISGAGITDGTITSIRPTDTVTSLSGTATGIWIYEYPQPWVEGKMPFRVIPLDVYASTVTLDGEDVAWATVSVKNDALSFNGDYNLADLEYFALGERAYEMRGNNWPYNYEHKYVIAPQGFFATGAYDCFTLQYFYQGKADNIVKSPKTIQVAITAATSEDFLSAFEEAIGKSESASEGTGN